MLQALSAQTGSGELCGKKSAIVQASSSRTTQSFIADKLSKIQKTGFLKIRKSVFLSDCKSLF